MAQQFENVIKTIEEGFFDRIKAQGAGAVGAMQGLKQQTQGVVQGAIAGIKRDVAGVEAAKKLSDQGAASGEVAKIQSYKEIANKKLQATLNEIVVDLGKLGVNTTNFRALGYYNVIDTLDKTLDNIAQSVQSPAPAAKPVRYKSKAPVAAAPITP
jgi:hypothetical protein